MGKIGGGGVEGCGGGGCGVCVWGWGGGGGGAGWEGEGGGGGGGGEYIEISRYFSALWIHRVTLVTKIKLWYSLGY